MRSRSRTAGSSFPSAAGMFHIIEVDKTEEMTAFETNESMTCIAETVEQGICRTFIHLFVIKMVE
jgi:hypothetical protein